MSIADFILDLRRDHNVVVSFENGELKVRAPQQNLNREVIAELRSKKEELIDFFRSLESTDEVIVPVSDKAYYRASSAQKRLYFIYELDKDSLAYNLPRAVKMKGELDPQQLQRTFTQLIERHESLRTCFLVIDGEVCQKIQPEMAFDLEHLQAKPNEVRDVIEQFVRPFDLENGPLLRVGLIRLNQQEHVLLLDMHHIISDGFSQGIMIREFLSLYNHEQLPPLTIQYKDYAEWQYGKEQQPETKQMGFWLNEFAEDVATLELPTDFTRPSVKGNRGSIIPFELSEHQSAGLQKIAETEGVTLFMVLLAAYNVLLSKLSGQEDIVIGTPIAGRQHADLEGIIGMFVNTLPLRNFPESTQSFKAFLSEVKTKVLACFDNQSVQYEDLINNLNLERNTSHNPLFDVMFVYHDFQEPELALSGLKISALDFEHDISKFDLTLSAERVNESLVLKFEYANELFKKETIERFISYFERIVSAIVSDVNTPLRDIDILTRSEKEQLLVAFNDTQKSYPDKETIVSLFEKQVEADADKSALFCEGSTMSYGQLKRKSDQVANYLIQLKQVRKGDRVGVMLQRETWLIPVIFGVLKAGGVYVPIDPGFPVQRIHTIIEASKLKALITRGEHISEISIHEDLLADLNQTDKEITSQPANTPDCGLDSHDLAYVIYTSGSTGKPKGVMIEHHSVVNRIMWMQNAYPIDETDTLLQKTPIVFDVSVWELFWWSFTGASLCLLKPGGEKEPGELIKAIEAHKVTTMHFVPSMLSSFLAVTHKHYDTGRLRSLKQVFTSGEALKAEHVQQFGSIINKPCGTRLINLYGPTEATVDVSFYECDFSETVTNPPIGKPIDNTTLHVLSKDLTLLPVGVPGELHIGGVNVGRGYLDDPVQTNEKFITDPLTGEGRMYKTGDLVKWLPDGNIAYLGRIDHQVKIRGFRIELGEIESQLLSHKQIEETVVLVKEKEGDKFIVAYYVAEDVLDEAEMRAHLSERIPGYMVPAYFVHLEAMPLTPNGKINRKVLPAPEVKVGEFQAPATEEERQLAEVWTEVLGIERLSVTDNFFRVGGDSIKSIQIGSRLRDLGYEVTVQDVFTHQTVRQLAANLKRLVTVSDQSVVEGVAELNPTQRWFFEGPIQQKHHFNQSVLLNFPDGLSRDRAERIFNELHTHHDALRMVFREAEGQWQQENKGTDFPVSIAERDLRGLKDAEEQLLEISEKIQSGIDLMHGPLMKLGLFHLQDGTRLLMVIHHVVIDGLSWRILFQDMAGLHKQDEEGLPFSLPLKTDSYLSWPAKLQDYTETTAFRKASAYWEAFRNPDQVFPRRDVLNGAGSGKGMASAAFRLDKVLTRKLLTEVNTPFHTQINDMLLAALLLAFKKQYGQDSITIDLEGHGREPIHNQVNISRTVGWFTSIYPVLLSSEAEALTSIIKQVKETLRQVPNHGFDHLLYRYLTPGGNTMTDSARILFNYLGQFDTDMGDKPFTLATEAHGYNQAAGETARYDWDISGLIKEEQLEMTLSYSEGHYHADTVQSFMLDFEAALKTLIDHCCEYGKEELTPSDLTYKQLSIDQLDELQHKHAFTDVYTLSPMQEGMLFHSLLASGSGNYVGQITCQINGQLDIQAIEKSMNMLMARYDTLRAMFLHEAYERAIQVILKERRVDFTYEDIRDQAAAESELVHLYQEREKARGFDLSSEALMRLLVLRTGEAAYAFIWSHHHILMDGWCMGIIVNEFQAIYTHLINGKSVSLPPVVPYANYIQWLEAREKESSVRYWREYLASYDSLTTLPHKADFTEGVLPYQLNSRHLKLGEEQTKRLQEVSAGLGVTANTFFQCAWGILLARYNNTDDVLFGSVVSGRPTEIDGIESMVGLFINTIPVRVQADGESTVSELLRVVQQQALSNENHHYHPLSEIQSLSSLGQELLDHILVFENFPVARQIEGADTPEQPFEITNGAYTVQTNYDLSVKVYLLEALEVQLDYNTNKFDPAQMERLASQLENIIVAMVSQPEALVKDISLFSEQEQADLQASLATIPQHYADLPTVQERLSQSFGMHATNTAIEYMNQQFTYAYLEADANKVARQIQERHLPAGSHVGVLCQDRYWMICAIIGILKTRMAFVPLETTLPKTRLASMIEQAGTSHIITDQTSEVAAAIPVEREVTWLSIEGLDEQGTAALEQLPAYQPDDPVYVYFTSGSTGKPKGVLGRNIGLSHFLGWEISEFAIDASFRFSQFTNPGFDVFMRDVFVPLCAGATICIPDEAHLSTGEQISEWLEAQRISFIHCVPSFFKLFNHDQLHAASLSTLRYVLLAGEKILPFELKPWYDRFHDRVQLVNIYGPTETTLAKGFYRIQPAQVEKGFVPVKAIPGAMFLIIDKSGHLCPQGAVGEICIRTPYRSLGYLDASQVQAESFVPNPLNGDKTDVIYKTGDLGRMDEQGAVEILGRSDHQVKIRGIRIELDDIKENILNYPGISNALVTARKDEEKETYICAYLVSEQPLDETDLRQFLNTHLPRNMVPAYLMELDEIPLLPNGKVNRKALPEPEVASQTDHEMPGNEVEKELSAIWSGILRLDESQISITKSFFDLGGHSLRAVNLINEIRQQFGVKLLLHQIFEHVSIQDQAGLIAVSQKENQELTISRVASSEFYPAAPAQERMYYQHLLHKESTAFNISIPLRVKGQADIERIRLSFQKLIDRHEGLRTSFTMTENGVVQKINEVAFELDYLEQDDAKTLQQQFHDFIRPFDLAAKSLLRCGFMQHQTEGDVLFVDLHHIICDGASLNILVSDFKKAYLEEEFAPLNLRYIDYAHWIREENGALKKQRDFWVQQLSGELPKLNLYVTSEEEDNDTRKTASYQLECDNTATLKVKNYAATHGVSEFMLLLSAYYILLNKISGNTDIIIGTDGLGRTQPGLKDLMGTFVNVLPMRVNITPDMTYHGFLEQVKKCVLDVYENQDFQFDQMVSWLRESADISGDDIIEFHFSLANIMEAQSMDDLEYLPLESKRNQAAEYGFRLEAREESGKLMLCFIYNERLYDPEMVQVFMDYYYNILLSILRNEEVRIADINMESLYEETT
ncbi:MAG: hypothetical protein Roseis2KO_30710 [Roseivirga sp.]